MDQGKKEVDYDKLDPVGVTAVAPVSSRFGTTQDLAFNKSEKMRNGPIASGILTTLLSLGCSKEQTSRNLWISFTNSSFKERSAPEIVFFYLHIYIYTHKMIIILRIITILIIILNPRFP